MALEIVAISSSVAALYLVLRKKINKAIMCIGSGVAEFAKIATRSMRKR